MPDDAIPPDDLLRPGDLLAGCRLERQLGRGGSAYALLAQRLDDRQPVVLKIVRRHRRGNPHGERRLLREAELLRAHPHPHLVPCLDHGVDRGWCYLTLPWFQGGSWRSRTLQEPLPLAEAIRGGAAVLEALAHLHALGLVHRDVKPSNVLLGPAGEAVLSDLGLALSLEERAAARGSPPPLGAAGTRGYQAPEQLRNSRTVDPRADLFAFGVSLHRVTSLRMPSQLPDGRLEPDVDLPPRLEELVTRCLAYDPEERYASANELRADLLACATD